MTTKSPEFTKAVEDSRKLKEKPSNDDLLVLYALFKQGTQDPPIDKAETPGIFDLKGKAKKAAWQKIVTDGVTPEEAQEKYVALVEALKEKHGFDPNKAPEAVGGS
ncbi:MAG: hypothetical protein M1814_001445 [Vezdaea aestivalis]|nr:MAG: hypothetical protein M1814_001445 [Vezdaea aestivalis]